MIGIDGGGPNRPANQLHEASLFEMLEASQQQRLLALNKLSRVARQQHVETLKKYRRLLSNQLNGEEERVAMERCVLTKLGRAARNNQQIRELHSRFAFEAVERWAPKLQLTFQRQPANLPRLYESYYSSVGDTDSIKKLTEVYSRCSGNRPELINSEVLVQMLRLFITHQEKVALDRLNGMQRRLQSRIEWGSRTQLMLQSTAKSFFNQHNFQSRKLKTQAQSAQVSQQQLQPNKLLPILTNNVEKQVGPLKSIIEHRRHTITNPSSTVASKPPEKPNCTTRQLLSRIFPYKAGHHRNPSVQILPDTIKQPLPAVHTLAAKPPPEINSSIPRVPKSPSLRNHDRSAGRMDFSSPTKIPHTTTSKQLSATEQLRTEPAQPCRPSIRFSYAEFLQLFSDNLAQYYHNSTLGDLQSVEPRRRPTKTKDKAGWLSDNLLNLVSHLTQRNGACQKAIDDYSQQYLQAQQKRRAFKISLRRTSNITYG